jgi:rod shape determining protein RodA
MVAIDTARIFQARAAAAAKPEPAGALAGVVTTARRGIAIWFAVRAFINIGMTLGMVPVTGLPLLFVSYGGSAMFVDVLAVAALQAVRRRHSLFR